MIADDGVMLNGLDLFTGCGGLSLALSPWVRPIAYCENDRFAQGVILSRISDLSLPDAGIWDDVTTLKGRDLHSSVDIIYGGFPCQDISSAGARVGLEGKRSGLFFEVTRLVRELRPTFVFLENVPDITARGLDRVLMEFSSLRYDCRWTIVSAQAVGACHIRERWFLLAHANGKSKSNGSLYAKMEILSGSANITDPDPDRDGRGIQSGWRRREGREKATDTVDVSENAPYANGARLQGGWRSESTLERPSEMYGWKSQPIVRRGIDGVPNRVERVRALGNAVVPLQAREAFKRLIGFK